MCSGRGIVKDTCTSCPWVFSSFYSFWWYPRMDHTGREGRREGGEEKRGGVRGKEENDGVLWLLCKTKKEKERKQKGKKGKSKRQVLFYHWDCDRPSCIGQSLSGGCRGGGWKEVGGGGAGLRSGTTNHPITTGHSGERWMGAACEAKSKWDVKRTRGCEAA